eukprot:3455037-Prymnesium_polylepis.1
MCSARNRNQAEARVQRDQSSANSAGVRVSGDHVRACGEFVRRLERDHTTRRNGKLMHGCNQRAHERQTHR